MKVSIARATLAIALFTSPAVLAEAKVGSDVYAQPIKVQSDGNHGENGRSKAIQSELEKAAQCVGKSVGKGALDSRYRNKLKDIWKKSNSMEAFFSNDIHREVKEAIKREIIKKLKPPVDIFCEENILKKLRKKTGDDAFYNEVIKKAAKKAYFMKYMKLRNEDATMPQMPLDDKDFL
jgi:hypothetical protein